MIIVSIQGGLGNQMFQYASAKRLALKHNVELKLDPNYDHDNLRDFKLLNFNINDKIATKDEVLNLKIYYTKYNKIKHKLQRKLQLLKPYYKRRVYTHKMWVNDLGILKASNNVYLDGYWSNEIFFKDIKDELINLFTIQKNFLTEDFIKLKVNIQNCNAASIHIRRGDYAKDTKTTNFFGLLPHSYYQNAIDYLNSKEKNIIFFVFSDDLEYVKKTFNFNGQVQFIENKNLKDYHELILMSYCKHNIIANSTFSWWGAWLNQNQNKIVISPQKWYNDIKAQKYYEKYSFVPENWIKL